MNTRNICCLINFHSLLSRDKILKQNKKVPITVSKCIVKAGSLKWPSRRHSAIMWSVAVSYSISYITVTCLVVYVDLRLILLKSFSVAVHFCSILFGFVFLKSRCGLFVAEVFHAWQQVCCFFLVIPIDNVNVCGLVLSMVKILFTM